MQRRTAEESPRSVDFGPVGNQELYHLFAAGGRRSMQWSSLSLIASIDLRAAGNKKLGYFPVAIFRRAMQRGRG